MRGSVALLLLLSCGGYLAEKSSVPVGGKPHYVIHVEAHYGTKFKEQHDWLGMGNQYNSFIRDRMQEANNKLNQVDLHLMIHDIIAGESADPRIPSDNKFHVVFDTSASRRNLTLDEATGFTAVLHVNVEAAAKAEDPKETIVHDIVKDLLALFGIEESSLEAGTCECDGDCIPKAGSTSLTMPTCDTTTLSRENQLWNRTTYVSGGSSEKFTICGNGVVENSIKAEWNESCDCASFDLDCQDKCHCPGSGWGSGSGSGIGPGILAVIVVGVLLLVTVISFGAFYGYKRMRPNKLTSGSQKTGESTTLKTTESGTSASTTKT